MRAGRRGGAWFAAVALLVASGAAWAGANEDLVVLTDGTELKGTIAEKRPGKYLVIVLATGEHRRYAMSDVKFAGPEQERPGAATPASPPARAPVAAPKPAPAKPVGGGPPAAHAAPEPAPAAAEPRAPATPWPPPERRGAVAIVPRVGFVGNGVEHMTTTCEGNCPGTGTKTDVAQRSDLVLGADVLVQVARRIRVGASALVTPQPHIGTTVPGAGSGTIVDLGAVVEGVFPVTRPVRVAVRAGGGGITAFRDGDTKAQIERRCASPLIGPCSVPSGPFFGWEAGGGVGAIFDLGRWHPRIDAMYSHAALHVGLVEITGNSPQTVGGDVKLDRLTLTGGVEF
jgi:hypothetical protein